MTEITIPIEPDYRDLYFAMVAHMADDYVECFNTPGATESAAKRFIDKRGMEKWHHDVLCVRDLLLLVRRVKAASRRAEQTRDAVVVDLSNRTYNKHRRASLEERARVSSCARIAEREELRDFIKTNEEMLMCCVPRMIGRIKDRLLQ